MANYKSYRTIKAAQIPDGTIGLEKLQSGVGPQYCVKHIFGTLAPCTSGCCCQWTVPSGVSRITWELWGAGGNGHGACSCDRCQHYRGASGGTYNTKTISTTSGCAYTVCAAGVYPCCSRGIEGN